MDVAVVAVALMRAVCTGKIEPADMPANTTVVPLRSTIEMSPAAPAKIARQVPSARSAESFGVTARHAPLVCVDVWMPMIVSGCVSSFRMLRG